MRRRRPKPARGRGRARLSLGRSRTRRLLFAFLAALAFALVAAARPTHAEEPAPPEEASAPADSAARAAEPAPAASTAERITEARTLADQKRFGESAGILRGVLQEEPENLAALSLLARVLAWGRRFDESIRVYERLLPLTADGALDRAGYARVLAWSGRYAPSLREFRRAIAADSTNLETRVGYARAMSWAGDLAGASREYFRILAADSGYGEAWLGLATVARWRGAPTASDRFLARAEARGADADGVREEHEALAAALAPRLGGGWQFSRERQYVSGTAPFTIESAGPYAQGAATLGRAVGLSGRAGRYHLWERRSAPPTDTTLNYDLRASVVSGDVTLLRTYPVQFAAGATAERLTARSGRVLYPLRGDRDFFGARGRVWGFWGRFTPSAGVSRDFLAIKGTAVVDSAGTPVTRGALEPGGVTNGEASLGWQIDHRWSAEVSASRGFYSDDNRRSTAGASGAYRARLARPRITLDYAWSYTDFDAASGSYFTPLTSAKHAAGVSVSGWAERASLDWGARYQFSPIFSSNFSDIFIHSWTGYADFVLFGHVPAGVEGYYSIDNNEYSTWGLTLSASARW